MEDTVRGSSTLTLHTEHINEIRVAAPGNLIWHLELLLTKRRFYTFEAEE